MGAGIERRVRSAGDAEYLMAEHPGHRDNPVVVDSPGALNRACSRSWDPTPGQAEAGNYKMTHAVIGGLHVVIETPLDRIRRGKPDAVKPWSVRMPCHYGYFKRTEGADGDEVDVYVGPEAHRAEELPVWIMDQCDVDTGAYDEHKVMVGFTDRESAHDVYLRAFSDGRGAARTGAVARTTFDGLKHWLSNGDTKKPVLMREVASVPVISASYTPASSVHAVCSCIGPSGGSMAEATSTNKTESSAIWLGKASAVFAKGLAAMSPTERVEFMASAAVNVGDALGKAEEAMNTVGEGHDRIGLIEDQWDGPPDDKVEIGGGHGPGSTAAPGKVNVGPNQSASGNGAEKMEREYSRHASAQTGVQRATEELGEAIMGMRGAMKSVIGAVRSQGLQIEALKAGTAVVDIPNAAAIEAMIASAVGKAIEGIERSIAKSIRKAVAAKTVAAKAEGESDKEDDKESGEDDEEEDDEEDDEASEAESGSGTEIEIVNENEEEDEDEAEADKAIQAKAARLRIMAKSRIKWANRRMAKAEEHMEAGKEKKAERFRKMAKGNLRKARAYLDAAKALRDGNVGPSSAAIGKAIAKAAQKLPKPRAENQETWPNKGETGTGKAAVTVVADTGGAVAIKALQDAAEKISKAASGMGMLSTTVSGLMDAFSSQSRGGSNLPPVFSLAKSGALETADAKLSTLADNNVISMDDLDAAREVIRLGKTPGVPNEMVTAKAARLPKPARDILNEQAA
jgi:inorganic pyrophosphatase-like protein